MLGTASSLRRRRVTRWSIERSLLSSSRGGARRNSVVAVEDAARIGGEGGDEVDLHRAEVDRPAGGVAQAEGAQVEAVGAEGQRRRRRRRGAAAKHRGDAGGELAELDRLGEVVVGADLEADHAVDEVAPAGQHDDAGVEPLAQAAGERRSRPGRAARRRGGRGPEARRRRRAARRDPAASAARSHCVPGDRESPRASRGCPGSSSTTRMRAIAALPSSRTIPSARAYCDYLKQTSRSGAIRRYSAAARWGRATGRGDRRRGAGEAAMAGNVATEARAARVAARAARAAGRGHDRGGGLAQRATRGSGYRARADGGAARRGPPRVVARRVAARLAEACATAPPRDGGGGGAARRAGGLRPRRPHRLLQQPLPRDDDRGAARGARDRAALRGVLNERARARAGLPPGHGRGLPRAAARDARSARHARAPAPRDRRALDAGAREPDGGRQPGAAHHRHHRGAAARRRSCGCSALAVEQAGDPVEITDRRPRLHLRQPRLRDDDRLHARPRRSGGEPQDILSSGMQPPEFFADDARGARGRAATWQGTHRQPPPRRPPDRAGDDDRAAPRRGRRDSRTTSRSSATSPRRARRRGRWPRARRATARWSRRRPSSSSASTRTGCWTFMNEAAERYIGMTLEEMRAGAPRPRPRSLPEDLPVYHAHLARITPENPDRARVEWRGRASRRRASHWEHWTDTGIFDAERAARRDPVRRPRDHRPQAGRSSRARRPSGCGSRRSRRRSTATSRIDAARAGSSSSTPRPSAPSATRAREAIGQPMTELIVPPAPARARTSAAWRGDLATGAAAHPRPAGRGRRDARRRDGLSDRARDRAGRARRRPDLPRLPARPRPSAARPSGRSPSARRSSAPSPRACRSASSSATSRPAGRSTSTRSRAGTSRSAPTRAVDTLLHVWEKPEQRDDRCAR